ncbi:unnamed protein product [Protopolystoma xenopodis]|uniref:Uncharacterized protein n=1 Tax=Protopolystoma xenopodis TaxID=117903 RepID=A0A3S5AP53_9PLAT|nr:unnamed protein product [Protopolystoma xenopodis]
MGGGYCRVVAASTRKEASAHLRPASPAPPCPLFVCPTLSHIVSDPAGLLRKTGKMTGCNASLFWKDRPEEQDNGPMGKGQLSPYTLTSPLLARGLVCWRLSSRLNARERSVVGST